jgi:hypothetical protein
MLPHPYQRPFGWMVFPEAFIEDHPRRQRNWSFQFAELSTIRK